MERGLWRGGTQEGSRRELSWDLHFWASWEDIDLGKPLRLSSVRAPACSPCLQPEAPCLLSAAPYSQSPAPSPQTPAPFPGSALGCLPTLPPSRPMGARWGAQGGGQAGLSSPQPSGLPLPEPCWRDRPFSSWWSRAPAQPLQSQGRQIPEVGPCGWAGFLRGCPRSLFGALRALGVWGRRFQQAQAHCRWQVTGDRWAGRLGCWLFSSEKQAQAPWCLWDGQECGDFPFGC